MKIIVRLFGTLLFVVLCPVALRAQDALLRKADRSYAQFGFAEAILYYEQAFEAGAHDHEAARRLADSYRHVRDLSSSEKWYALLAGGTDATPEDLFNYADALRANAKYTAADSVMHIYATLNTSDSRAGRLSHSAEQFPWLLVDPMFEGKLVTLPWNSTELDMSPCLWNGHIAFASTRTPQVGIRLTSAWDGHPFLNLYVQSDSSAVLLKGSVNTKYHESDPTFSADGTEMYFTRNDHLGGKDQKDKDGLSDLMIYRSRLVNGAWTEETAFAHNSPMFSTGHPTLSADGNTLYFSSNRPGGSGGVDIWMCERVPGEEWGAPVNMGSKVNTEGDEMFPCISGNNALFFSSDGLGGLGGQDIFLAWVFENGAQEPLNLGAPVNSRADDMSFVMTENGDEGYFSSDRAGGLGSVDIYKVLLDTPFEQKVRVSGRLISKENDQPLAKLPICLQRLDRSIIAQQLTHVDGTFEFIVVPQPMTISGGIPGATDGELPLDEHLLSLTEGDIQLEDIPISINVDVPLAVRVIEPNTGMPASGVHVELTFPGQGGRPVIVGITNEQGMVYGELSSMLVGHDLELELTTSAPGHPAARVKIPFHVSDARQHVIEHRYEMGNAFSGLAQARQERMFIYLGEGPEELGNVWSGKVLDSNGKAPIRSVPVTLLDAHRNELDRTTTAIDGTYRLRSTTVPGSVLISIPGGEEREIPDISPFGDENLTETEINGMIDLPVNAALKDVLTNEPLEGVVVWVNDTRDGKLLFHGVTDAKGLCQGQIPDRHFGTDVNLEVSFEKNGYLPVTRHVDFSVLTFLEQALGGPNGFTLTPSVLGLDLGKALDLDPIFFDYNDIVIRSDAAAELDRVARVMNIDPSMRIELRAHTDSRGSGAFNQFLSVRRAESTKAYMVSQGVAADRITASGVGERELVNACTDGVECPEAGHQANRRTEFMIVSWGTLARSTP